MMLNGLEVFLKPCCETYHFFNMLAFSIAEHLKNWRLKMWVVSVRRRSRGSLENGINIYSEDYCLLGCDANAVW